MSIIRPTKLQLKLDRLPGWLSRHRRAILRWSGLGLLTLLMLAQIFYPGGRLPLFATIDGVKVGGWHKKDAAWELDRRYAAQPVNVYFGEQEQPQLTPKLSEIGIKAENSARLDAIKYPWYLRLVPSSLFWAGSAVGKGEVNIARDSAALNAYLEATVGQACQADPVNASLEFKNDALKVVPAKNGSRCQPGDIKAALSGFIPRLGQENRVSVNAETLPPEVDDASARRLGDELEARIGEGVPLKVNAETLTIPKDQVLSWLDFAATGSSLVPAMNSLRAADYLQSTVAPKVTIPAGTSQITTRDFIVVSEQKGASGQALNNAATLDSLLQYVLNRADTAKAAVMTVPPEVRYTRTYSSTDAGLSALIQQYADDHKGVYGVSLIELSGQRRRAAVNENRQFVTASTYKLFVAYSTLKRVESGVYKWGDPVTGGRDLAACFDAMIVQSDNACAEALLSKIGFRAITQEMNSLGLQSTTFLKGDRPLTTPGDLAVFLATLESGQMLSSDSRARLLDAMKRNVYRQGIPAGTGAAVADKVGFLDNLLHDAAIVYSPQGTYVLVVMTEDSSWGTIADLTRKIEELRAR